VNSAVNNSGLVQARRVYRHNGVVSLLADNINAGGTIDVQGNHGSHGGTVNLTANKNLSFSGDIKANSNSHGEDGGTVNLTGKTVALGGTINTADDGGWRGNTNITAGDTMNIGSNEAYTIDSAMEHSGNVNVAANKTINVNSDIDTSSQHGDGTLKFKDGDSNGALTANLNAKIDLGNHQRLRGEATKVNVASTGDIQNGVDVASTDGAQVNVAAGTYDGDVDVNKKNIDLRGANWNVAEGANPGTPGAASKVNGTVTVTADNDSVRGFTIDPANGVVVNNADNATIANNVIQGSGGNSTAGVKLSNADNATVKNNTVSGFGTDVQATNSDDATIQGNSLGSKNGIALNSSDDAVIKGNTLAYSGPSTSGDTGISLNNHSDSANVANNTVTDYNTGVNVANSDDANIHGNTVADSKTGVKASNDDGLKVQNNVLVGRGSTTANSVGIDVSNDDGATLNGNTIVNYETGAKVANSDDVNFKNNVATGVKTGLSANHADRIAATGNTLVGANPAQGDGMLVRNSNNVNTKLSHNTVTNFLNPRRLINTTE
jgi:nitrous oxidase accessory protein NosD